MREGSAHPSHAMCRMLRVTFNVSHVTCHVPCVTCHMSRVTRHMSQFFFLFSDKVVKLIGGGSVINGPTLSSLFTSGLNSAVQYSARHCSELQAEHIQIC